MNYKFLIIILFLFSCTTNNIKKDKDVFFKDSFSNMGFTLIYNDSLKKNQLVNKKIANRSLIIFQKNLKKNTRVKITNLLNNKSILATVGLSSKYPSFYNSVISKRISDELELYENEPYIRIQEISENSIFLARKAKTYDEEKNVANKAPIENISINNLSVNKKKIFKDKKNKFNYIIKIADFYYQNTAKLMSKRIKDESKLNSHIIKLSETNYRVYLGPFKDLKSIQKAFIDIGVINFENIEIIKQ